MFDKEQFRKEIAAQLKYIPNDKRVAFAVRSAMRVLPLLAVHKNKDSTAFWFWKTKDKNKYLLAVLKAYSCSIGFLLTGKYATYVNAAIDAANATNGTPIYAATYALYAAANVANVDNAVDYSLDAATSTNANLNANAADAIIQAIYQDLATVKKLTADEFLQQPLWSQSISVNWQQLLADFRKDVLSLRSGFGVWLNWYQERLQGNPIDTELLTQWNNIPKEIEEQGVAVINAYLKNLVQKTTIHPLNRVRAIFIGYGEAGKTSLIRALHNEEVTKGTEVMTCGIEIRDWQVPDTEIQAHFWDFGGQVVFHSTHKFFLRSSCVYIIVINARADINNSEQAEYWLDHVKVFGGSAPVLLVGNKADEAQIHLQMQTLSQKYPNLKGYYPVSCTEAKTSYQSQFEIFKQALTLELQAVGIHQMLFTPAQGKVLDELRQYSPDHAFLSETDFNQICDKHGISNEGELNRDWLVDIFDKLGVMLHFEELKTFHNAYMLNPRWLTHGVYTLMNAKQARLNEGDMVRILANTKVEDEYQHLLSYPADKCLFISKAMQRFKLCYPLHNGENAMLIPALLPDEVDLTDFKNLSGRSDTLQFEFAFSGFLPRNLIGEFMVSRYEEIKENQLQSQRGAVFKSRSLQAEALVEADYHRRLIIMQVYGRDAKEYLTILYDAMLTIFGDLALEYTEMVYLPKSACLNLESFGLNQKTEKADYQQLLACAKEGQTIYITGSRLRYDLGKVLGFILSKEGQDKAGIVIYGDYIKEGSMKIKNQTNNGGNQQFADKIEYYGGDKIVNDKSISVGSNVTVGDGSFVTGKIENSFNSLQESKANDEVKKLLENLLNEIKKLNDKVPASQTQQFTDIAESTEALINETTRETPRKKWYEASLTGIADAAKTLGAIAAPVLAVAEKLSPLLLS
jgi:GTPase SAR1 family protein